MTTLFLDLETFCETPIQDGTWKYSEKAEVMLFAYAVDQDPVYVWDVTTGNPMPTDLKKALDDPETTIVGHNIGGFDRVLLKQALNIVLPIDRVHDTMARAYAHGLPGSLDVLCDIMQVPTHKSKDKEGKKLIQLFCKLRKDGTRATRKTHPLEYDHFLSYAKLDIEATRYIYEKLPDWNYTDFELNLWHIDQRINWRGMAIDTPLIASAILSVDRTQDSLRKRTSDITNGEVSSATRRDVLLKHILEEYGVELPDMQASTLEHRINDPDLPEPLKELLGIRLQATTSSTAKYNKILKSVSSDGRLRGTLQWCGASRTGRDCLAEGSLILVRTAEHDVLEKPIEKVLLADEVWDGDNWVRHEGVVFSGDKEVIEYDNIVATAEHNVYISTTEYMSLAEAKKHELSLWRGNYGVQGISLNVSE